MPFSVSCPECHYQFRVPDHVAGQRGKCPKCKAMFLAVRPGEAAASTGSSDAAPTKAAASSAAVSISDDETLVAKPRTLSIPKPRLLEKMAPPPVDVPLELVEPDDANFGATSPTPAVTPPPAPPAPPRGAPPKAAPQKAAATNGTIAVAPPTLQLKTEPTATGDGEGGAVYAHRRKKKSNLPLVVGLAVVALLALGGVGAGIAWKMLPSTDTVAQHEATGANDNDQESVAPAATGDDEEPATAENPFDPQSPLANWDALRESVATITVASADGTRDGTGLLVAGGFVATDLQLLQGAAAAVVVTLHDGRKFEAVGVLKRPRHGLALLQLDETEGELPTFALAAATPSPPATIYIADLQAAHPTKIQRRVAVATLPAAMRPRMPELLRDNDEIQLIEHAGRTSQTPDGRTYELPGGAPLLNERGQVVGVNLALGGDSRKGYAVGVEQLAQLVEAGGRDEFHPLRMDNVATADVPDFDPLPDPETPSDPPPASETPAQAVVAKLKQLAAMLGEKDWLPENADDYTAFGEFASSVTTAADMFDKLEGAEKEESQARLVEALESLADTRWPTQEQMQSLSKLAEPAALASGAATPGVFVYAECTMRPENLNNAQVNGLPVYGFKAVLGDEVLLIPVSAGGEEITVGSEWLILGQKMGDAEVGTEAEKNHASVVHAKYMLKKPVPEM